MKILLINYEWPPLGGGGGRAGEKIAVRLAHRGHAVTVLTSLFAGLPAEETLNGVSIKRMDVRRSRVDECKPIELLSFIFQSIPATRQLVKKDRPDVICAFFGIPGGPAAWWAKKKDGVPYLLALRGSDVPRQELARHQQMHLFTKPFLRRFYRQADCMTAVSAALRDAALKVAPGLAVEVIPNGVDTERFLPQRSDAPDAARLNLLFVGRLRDFKRVQDVIEALPRIRERVSRPVRFVIVGSGPYETELKSMAGRMESQSQGVTIEFPGWLENHDLKDTYEASDILLLPSLVEGSPNVLLEAMAMSRPCVATNVPGIRETLTHEREGLLVPACKPDEIAGAVVRIASDTALWRQFAANGRAKAESLSWDRVSERYEALLAKAAGVTR